MISHFMQALLLYLSSVSAFADRNRRDLIKKGIHHDFKSNELLHVFGTEDLSEVPHYQVVHPYTVDQNARRGSSARTALHESKPMYVHFKAFGLDFHMNITLNKDLIPKHHLIEHHTDEGIERIKGRSNTHSAGSIVNDDVSNVALDHTSGLNGIIIKNDEVYFIAPMPKRLMDNNKASDYHGAHIIFKRSALPASHPGNSFQCGVMDKIQSLRKSLKRRHRRSVSSKPEKTMELLIAADKTAINYHGKDFLHSYLLSMANMVAGIYKDPTLEYPITIAVTKVVLINSTVLDNATSMSNLLSKFRAWATAYNTDDDSDPNHFDNAALLTKSGCFGGCALAGLAYVGMCGKYTSQSVSKDRGLMSALTIAHEIGHNLGLGHDSGNSSSECPDGKYLMAAGNVGAGTVFEWSKCHSRELAQSLASSKSLCFNDKPSRALTNATFQHYGTVYDGNKQCELAFGSGFKRCTQFTEDCTHLMCQRPESSNLCDYTAYPPAHGTYCSAHHWCIYGHCVRDESSIPDPIDGGWTAWSGYTSCSYPCGGGVQWRERTCTNPAPKYGGSSCTGDSKAFFKTCNMHNCVSGKANSRDQQCSKIKSTLYSLYEPSSPCNLICTSPGGTPYYYKLVEDGTFVENVVSLEESVARENRYDMCILGAQMKVGCDKVLASGAIFDRCGVCGSDGSTCMQIKGVNRELFSAPSQKYEFASVPANAMNMHLKELAPSYNFISVRVGQSGSEAYYVPSWSKSVTFAGLNCQYVMNAFNFADELKCQGKSNDIVRPVWVNVYGGNSPGLQWTYYQPAEKNVSAVEYAIASSWGSCSKSCAGGVQKRTVICRRVDDETAISITHCKSMSKPIDTQPCNLAACPPQWYIHPWSKCSKTCGTGQKKRNITCSELRSDGKYYKVSDESLCTASKPVVAEMQNCSVIMCPAEWVLGDWGKCSTTCGPGSRLQEVSCQRINADGTLTVTRDLECTYQKPPMIQACNIDNPCATWVIKYSNCSKPCGGGLQYPNVACYQVDVRVADSKCSAASKPDISSIAPKPCNTEACDSYAWYQKDGSCSVSCGDGVVPITITCKRVRDLLVVADDMCNIATKPQSTKPCNAGECPNVFEWKIIPGRCSVTCGQGTVMDTVVCERKRDAARVQDLYCEASLKPTINPKKCFLNHCYSWTITNGSCSVTCLTGVQQPIVRCINKTDSSVVADSNCLMAKPTPGPLPCDMGSCPIAYSWKEVWGECSALCGKGTKTSQFKCLMESSNTEMSDSYCSSKPKPASRTVECTTQCNWAPKYGACLVDCGAGSKLTTLICQNEYKKSADISHCASSPVGSYSPESCTASPCTPYAPGAKGIPPIYSVGCYKDNINDRHLSVSLGNFRSQIDWANMSRTVLQCAHRAPAYKFFAIQFYGECWASNSTKYYLSGTSQNCYSGTGGEFVNYVYTFNSPVLMSSLPAVKPLGCYADDLSSPRPLQYMIDNFRNVIENNSINETTAAIIISKCAKITAMRGFTTFGIQFYGECWSGPTADKTYSEDGKSNSCSHGLGAINTFYVYSFA